MLYVNVLALAIEDVIKDRELIKRNSMINDYINTGILGSTSTHLQNDYFTNVIGHSCQKDVF